LLTAHLQRTSLAVVVAAEMNVQLLNIVFTVCITIPVTTKHSTFYVLLSRTLQSCVWKTVSWIFKRAAVDIVIKSSLRRRCNASITLR